MEKLKRYNNATTIFIMIIMSIIVAFDIAFALKIKESRKEIKVIKNKYLNANQEKILSDSLYLQQVKLKFLIEDNIINPSCDTLFNNESKIILLLSPSLCSQCIEKNIMDLNIVSEKIGDDKIVIVGNFNDRRSFNNFLAQFQYNYYQRILLTDFVKIGYLDLKFPVILILDDEYKIKMLFYDYDGNNDVKNLSINEFIKK